MKVRKQSHPTMNFIQNVKTCFKNEGLTGFYKGLSFPFATISIVNALSLVGNEFSKSKILGISDDNKLTLTESIICGAYAGLFVVPIIVPVELVKCKLQLQRESKKLSYYKGVIDVLVKTYSFEGIKGIYRGTSVTIFRESIGFAGQFGSYHFVKQTISKLKKVRFEELRSTDLLLAGGISGSLSWFVSFPFDVSKTLIQTGNAFNSKNEKYKSLAEECIYFDEEYFKRSGIKAYRYKVTIIDGGFISSFKHIYYVKGVKGFFLGFMPIGIVAFIANAIMFLSYETVKNHIEKHI